MTQIPRLPCIQTEVLKHLLLVELNFRSECTQVLERDVENVGNLEQTLKVCRLELLKSRRRVQDNRRSFIRAKRNWEDYSAHGDGLTLARRKLRKHRQRISDIREELTNLDEDEIKGSNLVDNNEQLLGSTSASDVAITVLPSLLDGTCH